MSAARQWLGENDQLLIRIGVITLVFVAAFVLGRRPSILPLVAIAGIVGVLIYWRWPVMGIVLTLLGGFAIPYSGPSGLNVTMLGIALLTGIWLAEMLILKRKFEVVCWRPLRAGLVFAGAGVVSLLVGLLPWFPTQHAPLGAQFGGLALILLSVAALGVVSNRVTTLASLKFITFSFIAYGSLHILTNVLPFVSRLGLDRLFQNGTLGSMFWVWLVALSFSQAVFNRSLNVIARLALGAVAVGIFYVAYVIQNDWKSGWVPMLVAVGVILAVSSWRMIVLFAFGAMAGLPLLLHRLVDSDVYSYSTRLEAWDILSRIVRVNPVTGLGPANYYWYTPLFPIRGYFVRFNSHSQYVDMVAQFGILGLLAFVWFMVELARVAWQMYRPKLADDFARAYVYGVIGGLVASIVAGVLGDWLFPFFYNVSMAGFRASILPWIFLGGLMAMTGMNLERRQAVDATGRIENALASPPTAATYLKVD